MTKKLVAGTTIGIIGAGQLGKMLAQSAQKMGYIVSMYDPNPSSCGFNVAHSYTVAEFNDRDALLKFVSSVDVVTYEFENIDGELLKELEQNSYLPQGTNLLLISQNRLEEKKWLNNLGIETADFVEINHFNELVETTKTSSLPAILKTTRFGYDGKGQIRLNSLVDIEENAKSIQKLLDQQTLVLEAFCDFDFEVSVIVARDLEGTIKVFPTSRNHHAHGVLYSSLVGEYLSSELTEKIHQIAQSIAEAGQLVGVCGIEFFVTKDKQLLVNEIAPRPHNSGHYTIEATNVSQFDQHILAITGHSLMNIRLMEPALMINILGQHMPLVEEYKSNYPDAIYHVYDKGKATKQRKMGHFTLTHPNLSELEDILYHSSSLQTWQEMF